MQMKKENKIKSLVIEKYKTVIEKSTKLHLQNPASVVLIEEPDLKVLR